MTGSAIEMTAAFQKQPRLLGAAGLLAGSAAGPHVFDFGSSLGKYFFKRGVRPGIIGAGQEPGLLEEWACFGQVAVFSERQTQVQVHFGKLRAAVDGLPKCRKRPRGAAAKVF